ncbi:GL20347 [Drosophila persimilis]|uniref:GL20347 n=1 Tax=Drosophila persimilis TaxID=7234 RepID=B4GXT5_DROPE|nr:GL20347 [Drosophila persimilis]
MSDRRTHTQMGPPPPPPKPNKSQTSNGGNGNGNGSANGVLPNGNSNSNNSYSSNNSNNKWQHGNKSVAAPLVGGGATTGEQTESQNTSASRRSQTPPRTEQVVMTPRGKTANSTVILIERKLVDEINDRVHVAGGDHTGIIINKDTVAGQKSASKAAALSLEFRVFLVSANTGKHSQESRTLRFWFRDWLTNDEKQAHIAQDFFKELVSPQDFPRDYVGFIKKIMKLMQHGYSEIQSIEIELRILEQTSAPPSRPPRDGYIIYCYGDCNRKFEEALLAQRKTVSLEESQFESPPLTQEKVLELIEQAYPNPVSPEDLAKDYGWSEQDVLLVIQSLQERGLIKSMEYNAYTRIHHEDKEIKVVKQMPTIASNKQPTIAIITAQYCEKLAVDAMLENKETFVRYTTVDSDPNLTNTLRKSKKKRRFGESNVYTLGNIGAHRIVSTKLPSVGSTREAMTATGNTTTRLLGTFQKVDFVFIVGVAGGVPHYTDYKKHVRLGDVVISYVDKQRALLSNSVKTYFPINDSLQQIAESLQANMELKRPWESYLGQAQQTLAQKTESDFGRPDPKTDKLFMNIGNNEVIEVAHPIAADEVNGVPRLRLHLGPIGSGRDLVRSDDLRTQFARKYGLLATDVEMSSVLDSIIGNCRESFILVKGISDYKDGMSTRKWQNFAALSAAAVVKSVICGMDAPTNV